MAPNAGLGPVLRAALRAVQPLEFPHKLGLCDRLFGRSLARRGIRWVRTAAGVRWKLDLALPTHRWIVYGKYAGRPFLDWARGHLPRDGVVVDSGANIGQMLLYLAQWVPGGRLLAIEPGEAAADWLRECLQANPGLPVELLRCGLGDRDGEMALVAAADPTLHGACDRIGPAGAGPRVRIRRLEDVLGERGIGRVDLWKLDVEGYEPEAIAGAAGLLSRQAIRALYVELGFGNGPRIRALLEAHGYRCHLFDDGGRLHVPDALPPHTDGLFLPRQ